MWAGDLFPNYDPFLLVEGPRFAQTQPEALSPVVELYVSVGATLAVTASISHRAAVGGPP